jgi:hypothetical protein
MCPKTQKMNLQKRYLEVSNSIRDGVIAFLRFTPADRDLASLIWRQNSVRFWQGFYGKNREGKTGVKMILLYAILHLEILQGTGGGRLSFGSMLTLKQGFAIVP